MTLYKNYCIIALYYGKKYYVGAYIMKDFVENYENLSDIELISFIKNGRYECLQILVNRYVPTVDYYCSKYGLQNDGDDILQEATFSLYSSINAFDSLKSSFSTYANIVIKRVIFSYLKRSSRKKDIPEELLESFDISTVTDFNNPEKIFLEKESFKTLTETIKLELSKFEFEVLNLYLIGLSYSDIAERLKISEKSVDNALARIRKKLK